MSDKIKITTHEWFEGRFMVRVNGAPLIGDKGGYSLFSSRKRARDEALRRFNAMDESEKTEIIGRGAQ